MTSRGLARLMRLARSAREYLAGFGTSGSLLAGAALMFILASTMVAFRGWPHVGAQPSPGEVVVSPRPTAATGSPVARRLAVIAAAPGAAAGIGALARTGVARVRPGGALGAPRGTQQAIGQPASTSRPGPVAAPTLTAGSAAPACCSSAGSGSGSGSAGSGSGPLQPVQQAIKQTTGALGRVVSGTGNQVGSTVQQTTGAVGSAVQPVSPPAAGAVKSVGSGAAQTVTGVTKTIAGALSGVGGN